MEPLFSITFPENDSFGTLTDLEWLETNGLGGWSSSTVCCANTRRYHGILVSCLHPPIQRVVMLSRLDELIKINGTSHSLATRIYQGAVSPAGYCYLRKFEKNPFPTFYYTIRTETGNITLKKTIAMPNGVNATIIRYELLDTSDEVILELEPFIAARDYHALTFANDAFNCRLCTSNALVSFKPYPDLPALKIFAQDATFNPDPHGWYYRFKYSKEIERGLDFLEDLYRYGSITKRLQQGEYFDLVITTEENALPPSNQLIEEESQRRLALLEKLPKRSPLIDAAALAADQFLVKRSNDLKTIIAGYHWFTDWGRDAMISIPGLCLSIGRLEEAKKILLAFTDHISQGMIPNRFPDSGEEPEYNTVDATLWYFIAIYQYYLHTGDTNFVKLLYPTLVDSIYWHDKGTRYGIKTDFDGLLMTEDPSVQLTWMDAKIGEEVITPRTGKPVEINALWYNCLNIISTFAVLMEDDQLAILFQERAQAVARSFTNKFWNENYSCLYDVIHGDKCDSSIRPNQIIALSLPFAILDPEKAQQILYIVEAKLFTPFGLRTLDPSDPSYKGDYKLGNAHDRDRAYHQGMVWSWLLGPYITAILRYRKEEGISQARKIIDDFSIHFSRAGIGTISEIFDPTPPYTPRGCISQAWSIAEFLKIIIHIP